MYIHCINTETLVDEVAASVYNYFAWNHCVCVYKVFCETYYGEKHTVPVVCFYRVLSCPDRACVIQLGVRITARATTDAVLALIHAL